MGAAHRPRPRTFNGRLEGLPKSKPVAVEAPGWGGSGLGTGGRLWPSANSLALHVAAEADGLVAGKAVIELGCGCGAAGIVAAAMGASRVLLTDGGSRDLLALAARNAAANRALVGDDADVRVAPYRWGDSVEPLLAAAGPFDVVLGADVTYNIDAHPALCDTLAALLLGGEDGADPPACVLAHQHRAVASGLACGLGGSLQAAFAGEAERRGLAVRRIATDRYAWHGLRDVSLLAVEPLGR